LRKGYPEGSSRTTPIYNVRLSQPYPGDELVEHGVGEHWYFRTSGNLTERAWRSDYKNYMSNFIRTGDPNSMILKINKKISLFCFRLGGKSKWNSTSR